MTLYINLLHARCRVGGCGAASRLLLRSPDQLPILGSEGGAPGPGEEATRWHQPLQATGWPRQGTCGSRASPPCWPPLISTLNTQLLQTNIDAVYSIASWSRYIRIHVGKYVLEFGMVNTNKQMCKVVHDTWSFLPSFSAVMLHQSLFI